MRSRTRNHKQKNQGFSIITVIVAIAFIAILGLLVLYMAAANFQMKTTDLKSKDSFYTAEQALEEIRTGLLEDMGEVMSHVYIQVLETYSRTDSVEGAALDEIRRSSFREQYVLKLAERLQEPGTAAGSTLRLYNLDRLYSYVDLKNSASFDSSSESLVVTTASGMDPIMTIGTKSGIVLKRLRVIYVDAKGRASVIETDLRLGIPEVHFPTPSTLPDLMNMIVVADGGIVCENTAAGSGATIEGSIYAGLMEQADPNADPVSVLVKSGAGLSVSSGERMVCQGEIQIQKNGSFRSGGQVALWAQGITLSEATVELLGKTYLADDTTVESGNQSSVTISGEYYGFGSGESAEISYNKDYFAGSKASDVSSAIVINGRNTTLDLSGLEKLMLSGRTYIAASRISGISGASSNSDVILGESLTVKGTQLAYLAPSEILYDGRGQNPMTYEEYLAEQISSTGEENPVVNQEHLSMPVDAWGGKSLLDIGVDLNEPVKTVFYQETGGAGAVYFYLNFSDEQSASSFMQEYYQVNQAAIDQYLSFYFGEDSGILINDQSSFLRYITDGNVLTYDGGENQGSLRKDTDVKLKEEDGSAAPLLEEQMNYQNMWYSLNRKMISSYSLLKTDIEDSEGYSHDETDFGRTVFDNMVNEKDMVKFIESNHNDGTQKYVFDAGADNDHLRAVMYHNGKESVFVTKENGVDVAKTIPGADSTFVIDAAEAEKLRLVICTGDVLIKENVNFSGIIMAKGTITLESGARLQSRPLDAAKVFQAQVASGSLAPRDFFWEGDKYVLGNSLTSDGSSSNGNLTDTYTLGDYITYENWKKK